LTSAFHNLTTQIPHQIDLALPQHSAKPRLDYPPLRFFWLSPSSYEAGIEEHLLDNVPVRIYSVEKTIADCFKFRHQIGQNVALEALKDYFISRRFQIELLLNYARRVVSNELCAHIWRLLYDDQKLVGFRPCAVIEYFTQINSTIKAEQLSGEIYVEEGLEQALNVNRQSLRESDPHYLVLQQHIWKELASISEGLSRHFGH